MKTLLSTVVLLGLLSSFTQVAPLGTAFTCHGRLAVSKSPVYRPHDFSLELLQDASGGTQQAATQSGSAVPVTDRSFPIMPDFCQ